MASLVERLRADKSGLAVEAAGEIERCWGEMKRYETDLRVYADTIRDLQAELGLREGVIERLQSDTSNSLVWRAAGFRAGYHAAASTFARIIYELTGMTVPIGQPEDHHHEQAHSGHAAHPPGSDQAAAAAPDAGAK